MKMLLSATNILCQFISEDLPRLPPKPDQKLGVQRLNSHENGLAWQVNIVTPEYHNPTKKYIIAVEAYSRYAIIIKADQLHTLTDIEAAITERWVNECLQISRMPPNIVQQSIAQFEADPIEYEWVKNTDLSINGTIGDISAWLASDLEELSKKSPRKDFTEQDCFSLGAYLNNRNKRLKISDKPRRYSNFIPTERILDDWLFRFADGFSTLPDKKFPSPYAPFTPPPTNDNVIDFAKALKAKQNKGRQKK